jgi:dephospho-CoA kinase
MSRLPVVGLIGGIGAGKSTAGRCLAARGGFVVDCDKLGHEALTDPAVVRQLVERWGERVRNPDGTANRKAIAGIVFDNPAERTWLESVVFPVIGALTDERIARASQNPTVRFVVLDAAVLLEAGWESRCDRILYIDAPRELREQRVAARSNWTTDDLTAREAAQWPADVKKQRAHAVVVNDGTEDELQAKIDRVLRESFHFQDRGDE